MPLLKRRNNASTHCIPVMACDSNISFSGTVDFMKTVYPRDGHYRPSLTLSIVPEEEEEAISVLSVVIPTLEGDMTKRRRRLYGFVELVVDLALIMQRKMRRTNSQISDQEN